ncbi:selection and upkeep of intraepithelial T-cells protein 8-like [Oreochromis aureus]|uniref:selection and upkeep of intraepithelial T-cells protein 8-like n=1 Tax=Oreochromis aureus TaxID=47969 RepID=UPI0019543894|nr:selection and upkeep of intraepithelial T-cells protein 8-like [Oreochromis aureus]
MSAVTVSLCSTLMFVLFVSADQKIITAESGQDVTLTCRAPNNNIISLEWSRTDLGDKQYVLLYKDGRFDPEYQHPSFKNRVDLQDRQMKDGDVSLILKDVTINDTGTYECGVVQIGTNYLNVISIHLHVDPPGQTGGHTEDGGKKQDGVSRGRHGLIASLSVFVLLVGAFVSTDVDNNSRLRKQTSLLLNCSRLKCLRGFSSVESAAAVQSSGCCQCLKSCRNR